MSFAKPASDGVEAFFSLEASMDRALTFLTHAASQVMGRWLPPPELGHFDALPEDDGWRAWDEGRWRELAARACDALPAYERAFGANAAAVARAAADHLRAVGENGANVLLLGDAAYPGRLATIADPPLCLTVRGSLAPLARPMVSVIGSRKASGLAVTESFNLGSLLARAGVAVVSGGAFGCDIAAHLGVLDAMRTAGDERGAPPCPAVVVFAGGLASLYPRAHDTIFRRLLACGSALISERLWSAPSRPHDFPARNRIVSGLAPVTAVMQAALKSGAQVTARQALDQGREVLVLYHPAGDVRASGSQQLLAEGAIGFTSAAAFVETPSLLS